MSSFTQAMRVIDDFIHEYYPVLTQRPFSPKSTSHSEALIHVKESPLPTEPARVPLLSSLGQKSCSNVRAQIQMPLFDNSAMDGYALCSSQTISASLANPLTFRVLGIIAAGDPPPMVSVSQEQSELTCWAIMTGAPFPLTLDTKGDLSIVSGSAGLYDACVKLELVTAHHQPNDSSTATSNCSTKVPTHITITAPVDSNANRRLAGEDIKVGDQLLNAGDIVRKEHVMVLASMGVQDVEVEWDGGMWARQRQVLGDGYRRLRIGIINTGKEVVLNAKSEEVLAPIAAEAGTDNLATTNDISSIKEYPLSTFHSTSSQGLSNNPVDPLTPPISCAASRSTSVAETTRQPRPYLGASQIWNSNGPYIHAALLTWGFHPSDIEVLSVPIAEGQDGDDPEAFQATVSNALSCNKGADEQPFDVLISTGGVSTGVHDYVPSSILALGGEIGFHKLKMRPGGPMMFAHLAHDPSRRNTEVKGDAMMTKATRAAYFGLPGNPLAAAVCLRFIVAPALQKMRGIVQDSRIPCAKIQISGGGRQEERLQQDRAVVQKKPPYTRMYVPARLHTSLTTGIDGERSGVEALARGSNMTRALLNADSWVCFAEGEGREKVYEGDEVEVYGLDL
ncbi:hypothetical protein QFC24_004343 [Naganishia onofrii]|uniref:Uncharacterized protein n=1 Tax=Naganishia onofrii TaxID=1851511 RepID=A0ACC2XFF1_9TREE|nr:hypothetical protein QFC24_004343 [Naganishia onofrii]